MKNFPMKVISIFLTGFLILATLPLSAQMGVTADKVPSIAETFWHHADPATENFTGVSTDEAYDLLKGKKSRTVVVAIIDSGVDVEHEDLKDNVWVNEDEIPNNGQDDDNNGFVDDVHGWNFLGNDEGENIVMESLEMARIVGKGRDRFQGKSESDFSGAEKAEFLLYQQALKAVEAERAEYEEYFEQLKQIKQSMTIVDQILAHALGQEDYSVEDVENLETKDARVSQARQFYLLLAEQGADKEVIDEQYDDIYNRLEYQLNPDFDPRTEILGDDLGSLDYGQYGNNDVIGGKENCSHGTHVAGIVGAVRGNSLGVDGIATDVKLMVLRAVPDGDEQDKDIANSIRYAVDNGAHIINMSFGKDFSPWQHLVHDAMRYAEQKGVLLIHASGNDAQNNDLVENYPNNKTLQLDNWLDIGANAREEGSGMVASFSNYGKKSVDIFAPGVDIYSTLPDNTYGKRSGTSMASPVAAGVAALVWAYYPELTASEVKDILMKSGSAYGKTKVTIPSEEGKRKKTKFKKLSLTGKIVNAMEAVEMAEKKSR
jgi:subtilisin family serine protease